MSWYRDRTDKPLTVEVGTVVELRRGSLADGEVVWTGKVTKLYGRSGQIRVEATSLRAPMTAHFSRWGLPISMPYGGSLRDARLWVKAES